jgi:3-oxoacyl-[acyl-carrier-protein] synthase-3
MAFMEFDGIGISGLAAAVPAKVIHNLTYTEHFSPEEARDVTEKVGILERRFADDGTCASDLCFAAAERLFEETGTDRSEIDVLIFVSQTPDYKMPATSVILQDRLGLGKGVMAFDVNQGCAGFLYGLSLGYALVQQEHVRKVLLLDGETRSRVYSPRDRKTAFIFGDAGVAALLEKGPGYGRSWFSLNADGSRSDLIKINAGGCRNPSSPETLKERVVDEHGNIRSDEHGYMNGADVFNFMIREVPRDIKRLMEFSGNDLQEMDYHVFHQANDYMNSYLTRKLKLDPAKVPMSIGRFGNTSSVSIPLTIVSELREKLGGDSRLLLCGFGVGLSWATAVIRVHDCKMPSIVEV